MRKAEVQKMTSIAVPFGNGCHICVPRAWYGRRIIAMLHEELQELQAQLRGKDGKSDNNDN